MLVSSSIEIVRVLLVHCRQARADSICLRAPACLYLCLPEQCFMIPGPSHLPTAISHGLSTQPFASDTMYEEIKRVNSYCDGPRFRVCEFRFSLGNAT